MKAASAMRLRLFVLLCAERPGPGRFLGFSLASEPEPRRRIASKARVKERIRELNNRTRGLGPQQVVQETETLLCRTRAAVPRWYGLNCNPPNRRMRTGLSVGVGEEDRRLSLLSSIPIWGSFYVGLPEVNLFFLPPDSNMRSVHRKFLATIYKIWMMRHVDVPEDISSALAKAHAANRSNPGSKPAKLKYIPVVATVNGRSAAATLVPAGPGRHRLLINTALRKAAQADAGDVLSIELRLDPASRRLPVPGDQRAGLKDHPKAWKAFEALAPGHRRQFITWFDSAKAPETRHRRLHRAIDLLLERALLLPHRRRRQS
jgi:hypothetical protein